MLQKYLSHWLFVLSISLLGAFLYAIWAGLHFSLDKFVTQDYYVVTIIVPFIAFLLSRAARIRENSYGQVAIDLLVIGTALGRVFGNVPFISGHSLFLTYALLSCRSRLVQILSGLVLLQVLYLKFVVWHDYITSSGGLLLGTLAALLFTYLGRRKPSSGAIANDLFTNDKR